MAAPDDTPVVDAPAAQADERSQQSKSTSPHVTVRHFFWAAAFGFVPIVMFCVRLHQDLALQALAVAMLLACSAALAGGLLGFLFGIPRTLQQGEELSSSSQAANIKAGDSSREQAVTGTVGLVHRVNTNLEQISDWLTKILVGVGLTQVNEIRKTGGEIVTSMGTAFGSSAGAQPLAATILIYFLIFGFLAGYLWTRLYLASELRRADQGAVRELRDELRQTRKEVAVLQEVSPVALNVSADRPTALARRAASLRPILNRRDPQKGRWGGLRESNFRFVKAGKIRPLRSDPENFRIPLEVRSTDPVNHPLTGTVRFHLHDTFQQDIEEVEVVDGVGRLELVAYGAFTVGIELEDGTTLELDLADPDIDAPAIFKVR